MVKRPASSSSTRSLQRENEKLKKENARLRGETNEKAPVAPSTSEAYITGVCGGAKYMISFDSEGFDQNPTSELIACLSESIRDGRDFELTLKGGKKIDPKKTFSKNGILPNSFVYVRYTGPPLDYWVWMRAMLPLPCCHCKTHERKRIEAMALEFFPCGTFVRLEGVSTMCLHHPTCYHALGWPKTLSFCWWIWWRVVMRWNWFHSYSTVIVLGPILQQLIYNHVCVKRRNEKKRNNPFWFQHYFHHFQPLVPVGIAHQQPFSDWAAFQCFRWKCLPIAFLGAEHVPCGCPLSSRCCIEFSTLGVSSFWKILKEIWCRCPTDGPYTAHVTWVGLLYHYSMCLFFYCSFQIKGNGSIMPRPKDIWLDAVGPCPSKCLPYQCLTA